MNAKSSQLLFWRKQNHVSSIPSSNDDYGYKLSKYRKPRKMSMSSKSVASPNVTGSSKDKPDQAEYTPETFKPLLKKLVQSPGDFTPEDCAVCFRHLCVQGANDAQVRHLMPLLR